MCAKCPFSLKVFLVLCSSVFTTFYRVRVWRCSSPWLSLYAGCRTPLSFFFPCWPSREQLKHQAKGVIARLVYSRQKWDVSGPITALLTVTDDVCPSENTDERTKNASQRNRFLEFAFLPKDLLIHNTMGESPWKYPTEMHSVWRLSKISTRNMSISKS